MIVSNPNFQPGLFAGLSGLMGLGADYVAPDLIPAEDCNNYVNGVIMGIPNAACIERNQKNQQENMARLNVANRTVFVDNCEHDWEMNDAIYASLHLPRPANNCGSRTYGQTFSDQGPDTFASVVARTTPQSESQQRAVFDTPTPGAGSGGGGGGTGAKIPVDEVYKASTSKPVEDSGGGWIDMTALQEITDKAGSVLPKSFTEDVTIMGHAVPAWVVGMVVLGGIYLASKGGN